MLSIREVLITLSTLLVVVRGGFKIYNGQRLTTWSTNPYKFVVMLFGETACTGSLLDTNTVLTAGHCFMVEELKPEYVALEHTDDKDGIAKQTGIANVTILEDYASTYDPRSEVNGKDLALVKLVDSVINDNFDMTAIALKLDSRPEVGEVVTIVGYGIDSYRSEGPGTLKSGEAKVVHCRSRRLQYSPICVASRSEFFNRRIEQGDSGGPLVVKENGKYLCAGVVSGFLPWSDGRVSMIYAPIYSNQGFIKENLQHVFE